MARLSLGKTLPLQCRKEASIRQLSSVLGKEKARRASSHLDNMAGIDHFKQFIYGDDKSYHGVMMLLEQEFSTTTSKKRIRTNSKRYRAILFHATACEGARLRQEAIKCSHPRESHPRNRVTCPINEAHACGLDNLVVRGRRISRLPNHWFAKSTKRLEFLQRVSVFPTLTLDRSHGSHVKRRRISTSATGNEVSDQGLVGVCYILDEPSIGLHPRDNHATDRCRFALYSSRAIL